MSVIGNGWMNCSGMDKSKITKTKGGKMGFAFQFAINDKVDDYGNNVTIWHTQTQEEKDDKEKRVFIANGKANWTNGELTIVNKDNPEGVTMSTTGGEPVATETAAATETADVDGALPF